MTLHMFPMGEDPGPSFVELLARARATGARGAEVTGVGHASATGSPSGDHVIEVPHATTIAAVRYVDGVAMAGDRRATEGYSIAHRRMDKVFPADKFSAVAIAGAAGPAMEMVRIFQTQLEHYEKVEGSTLSLEGKANQLGEMVRMNLRMAMEGFGVLPLFAGFDRPRNTGRIFTYDITGGRYEEADYHATGSGGRDARTTIKLGWRFGMSRETAIELLVRALFQAADEDSATGGPDPLRGIYPVVATVTANGFGRVPEEEVAARFAAVVASREDAVRPEPSPDPAYEDANEGGDGREATAAPVSRARKSSPRRTAARKPAEASGGTHGADTSEAGEGDR
jgi:proteasome beta subunit